MSVAIVRRGFIEFANQEFLKQLAVNKLDELRKLELIDLIDNADREEFSQCLHQAENEMQDIGALQERIFTLVSVNGEKNAIAVKFEGIVSGNEKCVRLSLKKISNSNSISDSQSRSWGYYFSAALLLALFSLSTYIILKLDINNAPSVYFPPHEPAVVAENEARKYFPTDQVIVLLFEGEALFSDEFLIEYNSLADQLSSLDMVDRVMSVTKQDHISGTIDGFLIEPVINIEKLNMSQPSERAEIILADRFSRGALISSNGQALSMIVVPKSADDSFARLDLMNDIRKAISDNRLDGNLSAVAGELPVDVAELHSMIRDNLIFIPSIAAIGLALIWMLFKRIIAVVVSGIIMGVVVVTTMSIYVVIDQPFTLIASITPPLLSALTIATLVHLFNAIQFASQRGFLGKERIEVALNEIFRPALFTSLTTAAGMASLGASPIPPIAAFGVVASCGALLIFFLVVYAVPHILIRWDRSPWPTRKGGFAWMDRLAYTLCRIGIRYPIPVLGVTLLLLAIGVSQLKNITVETNLQEFFSSDHEIRRSTDYIDRTLVGTMQTEVIIRSNDIDGLLRPEVLKKLKKFQDWAVSLPQIDKTISIVDFVEEMNWGFNEEDARFRKIPEDANMIKQYLLMYDGQDIYDLVDRDYKITMINLSLNVHSAKQISAVLGQVRDYLNKNIDEKLSWDIVGIGRVFSDLEQLLVRGQIYSLGWAMVLIFGLMMVLWRSFWHSVICMMPNISPILLIFIFMGLFNIWLDMATAMIASVAAGIAVDDTIHIFHGFIKRVKRGISPVTALLRTTSIAGRAVMTTTIILTLQFMITITSHFIPTRNFGVLTGIGLIAALIFDLLVLPALLIVIYNKKTTTVIDSLEEVTGFKS